MKQRIAIVIHGAVQGVGFRPYVYRLATDLGLPGWVANTPAGVLIEADGEKPLLDLFLLRLQRDVPPRASIHSLEFSILDPGNFAEFTIRESDQSGPVTAPVLPDIATCPDCLREIRDPGNRRYRYPFTNCTNCGPRFSIITSLPYDRPNTTMRAFAMCPACRKEYGDPGDRRFHAQPNACPVCGPHCEAWDQAGRLLASHEEALRTAERALREGAIVALKGLGGFQLLADAGNRDAVERLRRVKRREEKPFALMFPSLDAVESACECSDLERRLLRSPESPIVLLKRKQNPGTPAIDPGVAPGNPTLGIMLPYTPLHHLLLGDLDRPVVATSGNVTDEPICTDERESLTRLQGMTDLFLVHDRPVHRHVDDSVVRVLLGREQVLRRARGYAPLPIRLGRELPDLLAVGPHLKNTVAVSRGTSIVVSQHIGDLETVQSHHAFTQASQSLQDLYRTKPVAVVSDLHPDYLSTRHARTLGLPVISVQHHVAHVASCMGENGLEPPVLGVSWDGTGYGTDGTIWGSEFILLKHGEARRFGALMPFPLPGGDAAVKEPRRSAAGLLFAMMGSEGFARLDLPPLRAFRMHERGLLSTMLRQRVNTPLCTSAGRLFDAVASLLGIRQICAFEGQAAMELEFTAQSMLPERPYPFQWEQAGAAQAPNAPVFADWRPMVSGILEDLAQGTATGEIASRFHATLAAIITAAAQRAGIPRVVLTGGCFQNRLLTEATVARLLQEGFQPSWHQRIPPNDGGVALGQIAAVSYLNLLR